MSTPPNISTPTLSDTMNLAALQKKVEQFQEYAEKLKILVAIYKRLKHKKI
jgi:hypothetical protein